LALLLQIYKLKTLFVIYHRVMGNLSKLAAVAPGLGPVGAWSVAVASLILSADSTRKRRREGGNDVRSGKLPPGGLGGLRPGRKKPTPRYPQANGKASWQNDPTRTKFYKDYIENAELCRDPASTLGKEFNHKFRVSYAMFENILQATRESGLFPDDHQVKRGQKAHPLSMKVLAGLRRLALGIPVDGLNDMTAISGPSLRVFIDDWEEWFVNKYEKEHIKIPEDPEDIAASLALYNRLGLPGFVSSMDVVHVRYDMCAFAAFSLLPLIALP
jgi:hypothetical protein